MVNAQGWERSELARRTSRSDDVDEKVMNEWQRRMNGEVR